MKFSKLKEIISIWSWIYHEFDEPRALKYDSYWFRHLGSPFRRHFIRIFGFEFEWCYTRRNG